MANGLCDNLLTAVYLSAKCPVYFAPAMDLDMWKHPSTQQNIAKLQVFGNIMINPGTANWPAACMAKAAWPNRKRSCRFLSAEIKKKLPLADQKILVTAGPTYEAIDPVRFIGNHSSGKMGFAIADELAVLGADVTLIAGPSAQVSSQQSVKRIDVTIGSRNAGGLRAIL